MSNPAELRYTAEHEWVSVEGTLASVGITEYAAQQLRAVRWNRSSRSVTCTPRWTAR
jgi:glycine cleavage system H lipoate-binding protein